MNEEQPRRTPTWVKVTVVLVLISFTGALFAGLL